MTTKPKITKVQSAINLCKKKSGATLPSIAKSLGVSTVAAASLLADARRKGERVKCEMSAGGVGRYHV